MAEPLFRSGQQALLFDFTDNMIDGTEPATGFHFITFEPRGLPLQVGSGAPYSGIPDPVGSSAHMELPN